MLKDYWYISGWHKTGFPWIWSSQLNRKYRWLQNGCMESFVSLDIKNAWVIANQARCPTPSITPCNGTMNNKMKNRKPANSKYPRLQMKKKILVLQNILLCRIVSFINCVIANQRQVIFTRWFADSIHYNLHHDLFVTL